MKTTEEQGFLTNKKAKTFQTNFDNSSRRHFKILTWLRIWKNDQKASDSCYNFNISNVGYSETTFNDIQPRPRVFSIPAAILVKERTLGTSLIDIFLSSDPIMLLADNYGLRLSVEEFKRDAA